eukprot:TRINITY_DN542_c0_g1_i6.p1 TRINITY_DN542_c0_g1~~TRINITY_DN542_c0_g1_i6.p1  ORF type:complete len:655 (+),score=239.90 TRINITY_DN542_c0_g1_i6:45-1967(+)
MSMEEVDVQDISEMLKEQADADKAFQVKLSASVPEHFVGAPVLTRARRWRLLRRAKRCLWHTRLDEAEAMLRPYGQTDLGVMLALAEVALWRASLHESDEARALLITQVDAVEAHANTALERSRAFVVHRDGVSDLPGGDGGGMMSWFGGAASSTTVFESMPATARQALEQLSAAERRLVLLDAVLVLAFLPVARAVTALRDGSKSGMATGAYHMRKGWKAMELAQAHVQHAGAEHDEQANRLISFGVGTFQFAVSLVPPSLRWFIELIGFAGDREIAENNLVQARRSVVVGREATLFLGLIKRFFQDEHVQSARWLRRLEKANADSPLVFSLAGRLARHDGRVADALALYERALAAPHFDAPQLRATINYHIGQCHFAENHWSAAAHHLTTFLDTTRGKIFRPFAAWRAGVALWHTGKRDDIAPLYKRALPWVRAHESYDAYAADRMARFLDTGGFDAFEEAWDAAEGLYEAREERKALQLLDSVVGALKSIGKRDYFAQFYYLKGACLRRIGQTERAEKFLRSAIGELTRTETQPHFACAYALCELGEMLHEAGDGAKAQAAYDEAKALPATFHWHKMLHNRLKKNVESVKKNAKKPVQKIDGEDEDDDDDCDNASENDADWGEASDGEEEEEEEEAN